MIKSARFWRIAWTAVTATLAAAVLMSCDASTRVLTPLPGVKGAPFSNGGAWDYVYISADPEFGYPATRFSDITEQLTSGQLTERGITNVMIYGPYASTAKWRGLPPTGDLMDFDPQNGSLSDWREMVTAANDRGITVTVYLALLYLDSSSPLFTKAQEDRAAGIDSWQSRLLLWDPRPHPESDTPPSEWEFPRPPEGQWAFSQIAHEWYATSWGLPALYYGNASTMEFAHRVLRFWMDNGVQGFEFDAPQTMWGFTEGGPGGIGETRHSELVTYPQKYRPDRQIYTEAEGLGTYENADLLNRVGYTHIMLNLDTDDDDFVQRTIRGELSIDDLDRYYRTYIDGRREQGRGVYAPMIYLPDASADLMALDVAVQGGSGAIVSLDRQLQVDRYRPEVVQGVFDVTRALAASPAEAPAASRERVEASPRDTAYAIRRRSADGAKTAVNIYNLSSAQATVTVETGLSEGTRLVDLRGGAEIRTGVGGRMTVELPGYGWLFFATS
jgi:hypothetical protein